MVSVNKYNFEHAVTELAGLLGSAQAWVSKLDQWAPTESALLASAAARVRDTQSALHLVLKATALPLPGAYTEDHAAKGEVIARNIIDRVVASLGVFGPNWAQTPEAAKIKADLATLVEAKAASAARDARSDALRALRTAHEQLVELYGWLNRRPDVVCPDQPDEET